MVLEGMGGLAVAKKQCWGGVGGEAACPRPTPVRAEPDLSRGHPTPTCTHSTHLTDSMTQP